MAADTEVIRALARAMEEQARAVREEADALVSASHEVLWQGRAAHAMRERMRHRAGRLVATAEQHEEAARMLREHAREVDLAKERIAEVARRVQALVDGVRERVAGAAEEGAAVLDRAEEQLLGLRLPPPGSVEWLELGDRFPGARS